MAADKDYHITPSMGPNSSLQVGPEGPLAGLRLSMKWQDAWTMAVALAWSDSELADELILDPREFLKTHCSFELPEGLTVRVASMPAQDTNGNLTGWDPTNKMWYLKNTEVTMFLPPAPSLADQSVALSAYAATGRTYPFTLC